MTPRKKIFLITILLIQLSIIWPVYSFFADIYPLVLGLPLPFAWVVGMLIASFLAVLGYYLTDPERQSQQSNN